MLCVMLARSASTLNLMARLSPNWPCLRWTLQKMMEQELHHSMINVLFTGAMNVEASLENILANEYPG